jgi:hypothetical protein
MKNYLLLRDNVQSGPYALEDLERLTLRPLDLVWIEGESTRWYAVTERPELARFVVKPKRQPPVPYMPGVTRYAVSRPRRAEPVAPAPDPTETSAPHPVPEFQEVVRRQPRKFHFRPMSRTSSPIWILGLFICVVAGAAIVKNILENPQAEAYISPVKMAAQPLPALPEEKSIAKPADIDYQNAIKKETVTPDSLSKPISSISLKSLRRKVTIATNEYRTSIFGGINDLQVRVHNGSEQVLDKVNLLIEFFKPNGAPLRQERYSVYGVQPHSQKILVVPPSKRGVKVRYKLLGVEMKEPAPEQTTA